MRKRWKHQKTNISLKKDGGYSKRINMKIIRNALKALLPKSIRTKLRTILDFSSKPNRSRMPTRARQESNIWLRHQCRDIQGKVLSIGSSSDDDREGDRYRNYFPAASSYTTSEVSAGFDVDLVLDVRSMPQISAETYDCVFCSGVIEHVDDFRAGLSEITRILKTGGVLLVVFPFRYAIHMEPNDYWRFTEHGVRFLLKQDYRIVELLLVDLDETNGARFPAGYWVKAIKQNP